LYGRRRDRRRRADHEDRKHHQGHRHRDDSDNIARVKLKIPKFIGKEDADAYLKWVEQCDQIFRVHNLSDQRCVNLASVEFSGYALTWWNQVQENQLELGCDYINTWAELKRVMRRRFVPSSYQCDLRNRLQVLMQGKRTVDEYYKEMELLLVRAEIREDPESKMAKFLSGLNEEIAGFVEMFPYHSLQDLVDQAKRTERKIQHEAHGKSYSSHSIAAPWRKQQSSTSFGGGRSHGAAARPSSSNATSKMVVSSASSLANRQRPAASTVAPSANSAATSSTRSRAIECHKTMIVNEHGEWESESDLEDEGPRFDDEIESEKSEEIQPDEADNNCFISRRVLSVAATKEDNNQRHNLFHTSGMIKEKLCSIIVDNGSCKNMASQELVERLGIKERRHPSPYKIQWLNDCGALKVTNVVTIPFSIGRYNDQVVCDEVPMQAC
jgi:hypothetical protein